MGTITEAINATLIAGPTAPTSPFVLTSQVTAADIQAWLLIASALLMGLFLYTRNLILAVAVWLVSIAVIAWVHTSPTWTPTWTAAVTVVYILLIATTVTIVLEERGILNEI